MIILDLEWNSGCDEERLEEILQIGAVKVDHLGGPIRDTFCVYIKPRIHKEYCRNAEALPELERSCGSKILFPDALRAFLGWCGGETQFAAWGAGDLRVLRQNAERWGLECWLPEDALNLQSAFSHTLQAGQQIALHRAVEYCLIPTTFTFHNALNDAVYTALVAGSVTQEGIALARSQPKKLKRTDITLRKGWTGPFDSWEAALNSGTNRHPTCLICGKGCGVGQWFYIQPRLCYSMFQCGGHGQFLCTLEVTQERGQWWAKLSIAPMDRERKEDYLAAKRGHLFECARTAVARERRRWSYRNRRGRTL